MCLSSLDPVIACPKWKQMANEVGQVLTNHSGSPWLVLDEAEKYEGVVICFCLYTFMSCCPSQECKHQVIKIACWLCFEIDYQYLNVIMIKMSMKWYWHNLIPVKCGKQHRMFIPRVDNHYCLTVVCITINLLFLSPC
jgi:hypothetical protein